MKVYSESSRDDIAISRIINAVKKYAPDGVEFVKGDEEADLIILYVYGFRRHTRYNTERLHKAGKKYAIVQLCVRSTPNPKTEDWLPIWEKAEVVWSYYDLPELCREDGNPTNFNFYYAPLGVDSAVFKETKSERKFIVASTGSGSRFSLECKNEVISAASGLGTIFQLGVGEDSSSISYSNNMDDSALATYYSQCKFVSGLHKIEGFELPVIEGILCGARPICFDTPNFRHWFDGLAEFIPQDRNISENIRGIFTKGAKQVSDDEKVYVKNHFDWKAITGGFWKMLEKK
ncbi:MAG TPA: hypothetical protein VFI61_02350 [Patescibacteria group bacterium]|nr:hypothetical protein [Patescibacteria group bacterium]